MSSQSLTKGKTLRKRSKNGKKKDVSPQGKIDALFKTLASDGHKLDERLKEERFHILLKRIANGRCPYSIGNRLAKLEEGVLARGSVDSIFKASSALKVIVTLKNTSFSDGRHSSCEFIGIRTGGVVQLVGADGSMHKYDPSKLVYGQVVRITSLPADLRKWDPAWSTAFLKATMAHRVTNERCNKGSSQKVIHGGIGKLHQIRKINRNPSKKQLIKQEQSKEIFDMPDMPLTSVSAPNF
jgi:hypothetical protein